jgi:hypothetical protein
MTCKVYGNVGHLGNDCPRPMKSHNTSTMGIANKEEATIMAGVTNLIYHSKVIRIIIQISIRINLDLRIWC